VTSYTTTNMPILFRLASIAEKTVVSIPQREMALIFISLTVTGLLSSFVSLVLIQNQTTEHRRLILCGYKAFEIILSKFILLLLIILFISVYISMIIQFFFNPQHILSVTLGFLLIGFVYGSYGMLIGTILKGELEGVLFIVLLANLDVSWLQNPIFYTAAPHKMFIRSLPSYFPSQVSLVSAFSEESTAHSVWGSIVYGLIFLTIAFVIYAWRMRIVRSR